MNAAERFNELIRAADAETRRRQEMDASEGGEAYARWMQRDRERAAADVLEQARLQSAQINRRPTRPNA